MIPFLAKKWRDKSLVGSLRIDFYIITTLAPEATIFLTKAAIYFLSSFKILSMAV